MMTQDDYFPEEKRIQGKQAELEAGEILYDLGFNRQQIDWLGDRFDTEWIKFEIKCTEPFNPPPFVGQGLPPGQVRASNRLLEQKGIRTYFAVKDPNTKLWIGQFLDVLENGEHYDTQGLDPQKRRRVYTIENFEEGFLSIKKGNNL